METIRLIIDAIKENDKEDYFHNISHDKKVLETFICKYEEEINFFDFSKYINRDDIFAIRLKTNKKLIGIITIFDIKEKSCEIGYGIGSNYWNNGYASEAVNEFINYCFNKLNLKTIYASYFIGNNASKRVMEKCNMTYSHTILKELEYLGIQRDLDYYKIEK